MSSRSLLLAGSEHRECGDLPPQTVRRVSGRTKIDRSPGVVIRLQSGLPFRASARRTFFTCPLRLEFIRGALLAFGISLSSFSAACFFRGDGHKKNTPKNGHSSVFRPGSWIDFCEVPRLAAAAVPLAVKLVAVFGRIRAGGRAVPRGGRACGKPDFVERAGPASTRGLVAGKLHRPAVVASAAYRQL